MPVYLFACLKVFIFAVNYKNEYYEENFIIGRIGYILHVSIGIGGSSEVGNVDSNSSSRSFYNTPFYEKRYVIQICIYGCFS